jgi:hypothetical protein
MALGDRDFEFRLALEVRLLAGRQQHLPAVSLTRAA